MREEWGIKEDPRDDSYDLCPFLIEVTLSSCSLVTPWL